MSAVKCENGPPICKNCGEAVYNMRTHPDRCKGFKMSEGSMYLEDSLIESAGNEEWHDLNDPYIIKLKEQIATLTKKLEGAIPIPTVEEWPEWAQSIYVSWSASVVRPDIDRHHISWLPRPVEKWVPSKDEVVIMWGNNAPDEYLPITHGAFSVLSGLGIYYAKPTCIDDFKKTVKELKETCEIWRQG